MGLMGRMGRMGRMGLMDHMVTNSEALMDHRHILASIVGRGAATRVKESLGDFKKSFFVCSGGLGKEA